MRSDFLKREAIFVCGDGETIEKCEDEGFLTLAQSAKLSSLVNNDVSELLRSEEFIIFRSWLKGGRVIQDILDAKAEKKQNDKLEKKRVKLLAKEAEMKKKKLKKEVEKYWLLLLSILILNIYSFILFREQSVSDDESIESNPDDNDNNKDNNNQQKEAKEEVKEDINNDEDKNNDEDEDENENEDEDDKNESDEESEIENDPRLLRISERSQRLQERSAHVEDAIKAIANLHMAYRHGQVDGLSVRDLELKRGQLRMEVY